MSNPYHTREELAYIAEMQQLLWTKEIPLDVLRGFICTLSDCVDKPNKRKMNSLDTLECKTPCINKAQEQKEKAMYNEKKTQNVNLDVNVNAAPSFNGDKAKADYLFSRLYAVARDKEYEARKTFHLDEDDHPTSPKELVDRIKAGDILFSKRSVNEDGSWKNEDDCHYCVWNYIEWRKTPADWKGYNVWEEKLNAARQAAEDTIRVSSPEDGLKALREFESTVI